MKFDSRFAPLSLAAFIALLASPVLAEDAPQEPAAIVEQAATIDDAPQRPAEIPPPAPAFADAESPLTKDAAQTSAEAAPAAAAADAAPALKDESASASPEAAPAALSAEAESERKEGTARTSLEAAPEAIPADAAPAPMKETARTSPEAAPVEPAPAEVVAEPAPPAPAAVEPEQAPPAQSADTAPVVAPEATPKAVEAEAAPPPSPIQTALREAVARMTAAPIGRAAPGQTPAAALRREREAIAAFYEARDFTPLWIKGESFAPAARAVVARIGRAREDGLDLAQYAPPTLDAASPEAMARADLALSQAAVGYARQASGVRVEPRSIGLITAKPEVAAPQDVLATVAAADDAGEALADYNPPHQGYRDLREKLFELRRERPAVAGRRIAPGPVLKVGMKDPRVPLVRARFGINAAADNPGENLVYDTRVASAVADFQRAHGLPANGVLTARTIAALSGGDPSRLENELLANMERWRWLPRDMGATRIEVNIPDFRARVVRDGKVVHAMKVIVGKPETPTPVFSDTMEFMVVNPSWHVPQSIIRKQLAQDPSYYARNGYEVVRRGNNIFVRQPPGERNALGFIKFMFPNDHAVYMHDTPTRNLFNAARRAFSHGCVRVDQPFRFAEALMPETGWSEQRLRTLIGKGERTIRFNEGVPVHLMYFTAFVDEGGKMQLRDDLYGQSRKLQAALGL